MWTRQINIKIKIQKYNTFDNSENLHCCNKNKALQMYAITTPFIHYIFFVKIIAYLYHLWNYWTSHPHVNLLLFRTPFHYNGVIMSTMASQITSLTIVYLTVYSGADQRHQISASLAFVRGIHRWPVNSPHKGPVTRKIFPFYDVIMFLQWRKSSVILCMVYSCIPHDEFTYECSIIICNTFAYSNDFVASVISS